MTKYTHDIERYLNGKMSAAERHAFEKKALDDPFLAEALEGTEHLTADDFANDIKNLNRRILPQKQQKTARLIWSLRIAAGLLLLAVSSYVIWNLSQTLVPNTPLALEEKSAPEDKAEDPESFMPEAKDTVIVLNAIAAREITDTKESPVASNPSAKEIEVKAPVSPEEKLFSQPSITQLQPLAAPLKIDMHPEEAEKRTEANKPLDVTMRNDLTNDTRKKQAISSVSGAAVNGKNVITGRVTAAEDGSSLPGINVTIKGSTLGTITDANGKYQIETIDSQSTLVFSFIGLRSIEIPTGDQKEVNVQMSMDATQLSEVVVVGYSPAGSSTTTPTVNLAHPEIGTRTYKHYLETSIIYPQEAIANKTEGRVTIEFTVETDGTLTDFKIIRGIGSGCDEELIRLVKEGPGWIPTVKEGVSMRDKARVRLRFTLPN